MERDGLREGEGMPLRKRHLYKGKWKTAITLPQAHMERDGLREGGVMAN